MNIKVVCVIITITQCIESALGVGMILKNAQPIDKKIEKTNILLLTIPKCGTHLLKKYIALAGIKKPVAYDYPVDWDKNTQASIEKNQHGIYMGQYSVPDVGPLPSWITNMVTKEKNSTFHIHWPYTKESDQFFDRHIATTFFLMRDPRDQVVSMAFYLMSHKPSSVQDITLEDLIFDFIDGRQKNFVPWGFGVNATYPLLFKNGVVEFYKLYLPWVASKNICTLKFEHLVGPEGGSTLEAQINEIKKINKHLEVDMTDDAIMNIRDNLFEKTTTFREGKIGSWKKNFTPEMKAAFKRVPGAMQLLIDLDYEKDTNW